MIPQPVTLKEFLESSNLQIANEPPWTHSASCGSIWNYVSAEKILAFECRVFKPDKLCYFFVGRPAYKKNEILNPGDWECPLVFVMRFPRPPKIKRIFPFDSGAFADRRLPSYITMFDLNRFEISGDQRNIGRLISLVYRDPKLYFERRPVGQEELRREFNLTPRHREIEAVAKLARENLTPEMDDRAAAIEVQVDEDIPLLPENLLGIVIPDQYEQERELFKRLREMATYVETYRHLPSSLHGYHSRIVDCVERIYKQAGIRL